MSRLIALIAAAGLVAWTTPARSEGRPKHYIDAGIAGGLADGLGDLRRADLHGLSGAGGEIAFDLVYGANTRWAFGAYGSYARFGSGALSGANTAVVGVTAGAQARYIIAELGRARPWLGLGAGYRGLTQADERGAGHVRDGFTIARSRIGVDVTVARATRIGPVAGVDVTTFLERDLSLFFFGGLAGTFDVLTPPER